MDKEAIKVLLRAMRPHGLDAEDPTFAEALREAKTDPDLANWLAEEQAFDAVMSRAGKTLEAPRHLGEQLVLNAKNPPRRASLPLRITFAAMAAALVLSLAIWQLRTSGRPEEDLALSAMRNTATMPKLQFVCFNAAAVAKWINSQPMTRQVGFEVTKPMASMQMIGSSTFDWNGKPVVMIALQNKHAMAMLYVVRSADFQVTQSAPRVFERDGWASRTATFGNAAYVLTTRGPAENLNFDMPF